MRLRAHLSMEKLIERLCGDKSLSKTERTLLFREAMTNLYGVMKDMPDSYQGKEAEKINPLKHTFGEGFYIREINCPKGQILMSMIHKREHPLFILKGKCTIISEEGLVELIAPCYVITQPGAQRLIRIDEDCIAVTVHPTQAKTVEEAEEDVIAKDWSDPLVKLEI